MTAVQQQPTATVYAEIVQSTRSEANIFIFPDIVDVGIRTNHAVLVRCLILC
jgi:hypothetical protein